MMSSAFGERLRDALNLDPAPTPPNCRHMLLQPLVEKCSQTQGWASASLTGACVY
jgi:hypothetical protein